MDPDLISPEDLKIISPSDTFCDSANKFTEGIVGQLPNTSCPDEIDNILKLNPSDSQANATKGKIDNVHEFNNQDSNANNDNGVDLDVISDLAFNVEKDKSIETQMEISQKDDNPPSTNVAEESIIIDKLTSGQTHEENSQTLSATEKSMNIDKSTSRQISEYHLPSTSTAEESMNIDELLSRHASEYLPPSTNVAEEPMNIDIDKLSSRQTSEYHPPSTSTAEESMNINNLSTRPTSEYHPPSTGTAEESIIIEILTSKKTHDNNLPSTSTAADHMSTEELTQTSKYPPQTTNAVEELMNIDQLPIIIESSQTNTLQTEYRPEGSIASGELKLYYDELKNECKNHIFLAPNSYKNTIVDIFENDVGPRWHDVNENLLTRSIVPEKLVKAFEHLPVYGRPNSKAELENFQNKKIKEFVGCDLSEEDFKKLARSCSPKNLETGEELKVDSSVPNPGVTPNAKGDNDKAFEKEDNELCIVKKCRMRQINDAKNQAIIRLKYRSIRLMPFGLEDDITADTDPELLLEPGKDILYHIRIYRPFLYSQKDKIYRGRTAVVSRTLLVPGRVPLWALRDRLLCSNDLDMRLDVSLFPNDPPATCAKDLFPSGFMFINNVFYVDTREGCRDLTEPLREWAAAKRCDHFPKRDMNLTLDQMRIKLGHPDVYVHQGNCEHLFTFSEMRLVNATDPLRMSSYPFVRGLSQNHAVYCTTCAEFVAKWIVTGCKRVPFDPAFFCDTCFKQYLYTIDDRKIGNFKAYSYMGNELNVLKPV